MTNKKFNKLVYLEPVYDDSMSEQERRDLALACEQYSNLLSNVVAKENKKYLSLLEGLYEPVQDETS